MKVVTNSTPLIALSKINRLELLREVYRSIYIPEEVYTEVVVNGVGKPRAEEVASADWIICQPVTDKDQVLILHHQTLINLGECGAIVLAQEIRAERIIIDDRVARQVAEDSLEDVADLPAPGVLASEITQNLQTALGLFQNIQAELGDSD